MRLIIGALAPAQLSAQDFLYIRIAGGNRHVQGLKPGSFEYPCGTAKSRALIQILIDGLGQNSAL
jgi:hypothetical protein